MRASGLVFVVVPAVLAGGQPAVVWADEPPPVRALLADPTRLANWIRERDPLVESAANKTRAAGAQARQSRAFPNPQLNVGIAGIAIGRGNLAGGMSGPSGIAQSTNLSIGISEVIELGKRQPRGSAADLRTNAAAESAIGMFGTRITNATTALGRLAYVAARRDTVSANLAAARTLRDGEKVRLDHQDLSPTDFARIDLDTEQLEIQLARAEAELAGAIASCSAILYAPCSPKGLDPAALDAGAPLPQTVLDPGPAIEQRPIRRISKLQSRALGWDATLASRRAIPDITIGVGYTFDNYEYSGSIPQTLSFSIGIPLPLLDRGTHDAAAARSLARALDAEDRAEVREARGLVESLLEQRAMLQTTLGKLEGSVAKSALISMQTQRAFDLGQARLADLLLVERAHRDLLLEILDTRFDLFNAREQLRQALGIDDQVARATGKTTP